MPTSNGTTEPEGGAAVSPGELARIAALAGLDPAGTGAEGAPASLVEEVGRILAFVRILEEVELAGVEEPLRLPAEPVPFRDPDLPPDPLEEGAPGDRAPDWREGFFVLPRLPGVEGSPGEER